MSSRRRIIKNTVSLLLLLYSIPTFAGLFNSCLLSNLERQELTIHQIDVRATLGEIDGSKIFGKKNSHKIILGISKEQHVFLSANGVRFHGKIIFIEGKSQVKHTDLLPKGVYFLFQDLPKSTTEAVAKSIDQNAKRITLSCITSACRILKENGIELRKKAITPAGELESAIKWGFVNQQGKPIKIKIYATDNSSLKETILNFRKIQQTLSTRSLFLFASGSFIGYQIYRGISIVALAIIGENSEPKKNTTDENK